MIMKIPTRATWIQTAVAALSLVAIFVATKVSRKKTAKGRASKKEVSGRDKAKAKSTASKKGVASKKTAKSPTAAKAKPAARKIAPKKNKAKAKPQQQKKIEEQQQTPSTPVLSHGPDLHLIPVKGEIHPARTEEAPQFEKAYQHNENVALHQEQQRVKQIVSGSGKRFFKNPRQS